MTSKESPIQITLIYSPDQQQKIENIKTFLTFLYRNQLDDIILHTKEDDVSTGYSVTDPNTGPTNVKYYKLTNALKDYDSILNGIMLLDRQTESMNVTNNKKMQFFKFTYLIQMYTVLQILLNIYIYLIHQNDLVVY
jgi:hypothetical protein